MKKSFLHTTNLFLRSLLYSIVLSVITIPYAFLSILAWPFPLRYRTRIIFAWTGAMIWLLKVICHVDYKIEGLENIPKDRNGLVFCKHQSTWETFFLPSYFPYATLIIKKELLWVPFFGWGMATIEPIAINRKDKSTAMEQILKQGKACLEAGRWIIVFPEGTRIAPGSVGNYRLGGARLAVYTGYPVIPVAHNGGRFWPRRKFIKRPGTVSVVFGPLIESQGKKPEELMNAVKTWIENTMERIDPPHPHKKNRSAD